MCEPARAPRQRAEQSEYSCAREMRCGVQAMAQQFPAELWKHHRTTKLRGDFPCSQATTFRRIRTLVSTVNQCARPTMRRAAQRQQCGRALKNPQ